jgi:hypothetical protein
MVNTPDDDSRKKKAAILKELESVQSLLNEEQSLEGNNSNTLPNIEYKSTSPLKTTSTTPIEEFQIPLLDPGRSTTFELDFSKPTPKPIPEKKVVPPPPREPREEDIPVIDNIQSSSSLFDDTEEVYQSKPSLVTEKELKDKAQLIVQDLINDAITELEEKLDHLIPNLEERLKKKLEKAMDDYIANALKK